MSMFIVRVELHGVTDHNHQLYSLLHTEMGSRNFSRTIGNPPDKYQLPSAEYFYPNGNDINAVLRLAKQSADKTGKDCSIVVTQAAAFRSHNLKKA
ncbi:MAG: hypothetical protein JWQ35_1080 [Bacteriovoracaceae bacterium]|nr:hypothetical protein [Bacteriovoracaceae bacterium]